MNRRAQEVYGFGPRLSTRQDRFALAARVVILAAVLGVLVALHFSN